MTKKKKVIKRRRFLSPITIILLIFFLTVSIFVVIRKSRQKDCGKWLFLKDTQTKIDSSEKATSVFKNILLTEERYKNFDFPGNKEGLLKKFNLIPFKRTETVLEKDGRAVKKEVYDMLLAYAIDTDGNVYKYNMCHVL